MFHVQLNIHSVSLFRRMSDLEEQVSSILEVMVSATVTRVTKVIDGSDATCPDDDEPSTTEITHPSTDEKVC